MEWRELIVDGFERLPDLAEEALAGVRAADLDWPPAPGCNPLGWTVWHLTRVEDGQIADLMGEPDLWTRDGWHAKFNRPPDHDDSGYGHTAAAGAGVPVAEREGPARLPPRDHGADEAVPRLADPRRPRSPARAGAGPVHGRRPDPQHRGGLPPARRRGVLHPRPDQGSRPGRRGQLSGSGRPARRSRRRPARSGAADRTARFRSVPASRGRLTAPPSISPGSKL